MTWCVKKVVSFGNHLNSQVKRLSKNRNKNYYLALGRAKRNSLELGYG
jgi:hypothetical protein